MIIVSSGAIIGFNDDERRVAKYNRIICLTNIFFCIARYNYIRITSETIRKLIGFILDAPQVGCVLGQGQLSTSGRLRSVNENIALEYHGIIMVKNLILIFLKNREILDNEVHFFIFARLSFFNFSKIDEKININITNIDSFKNSSLS